MTPEQRLQAAGAVQQRMDELGLNLSTLATKAGIDVGTVRTLVRGTRWPQRYSRERICEALGWPPGEINRRATAATHAALADFTLSDLVVEVAHRIGKLEATS